MRSVVREDWRMCPWAGERGQSGLWHRRFGLGRFRGREAAGAPAADAGFRTAQPRR